MATEILLIATLKAHATTNTPQADYKVFEHLAEDMRSKFYVDQVGPFPTIGQALLYATEETHAVLRGTNEQLPQ